LAASSSTKSLVEPELTPWRFKLACASKGRVVGGLVATYALVQVILLLAYSSSGLHLTGTSVLQILGIGGDVFSVGILVLSNLVKHYPLKEYVKSYETTARRLHSKDSAEQLTHRLEDYHGYLQSTTSSILTTEVGGILTAISTTLGLIGALLRGG
jgi:hypothetical protein